MYSSPAERAAEERALHEQKLSKMEAEMKMVFQQKVQEKEAKLKQSEEELYARHREMKDALEKQRLELEDKKRRLESGRPLTPTAEKNSVRDFYRFGMSSCLPPRLPVQEEPIPPYVIPFLNTRLVLAIYARPNVQFSIS
jgi:exonuclease VII large subunit